MRTCLVLQCGKISHHAAAVGTCRPKKQRRACTADGNPSRVFRLRHPAAPARTEILRPARNRNLAVKASFAVCRQICIHHNLQSPPIPSPSKHPMIHLVPLKLFLEIWNPRLCFCQAPWPDFGLRWLDTAFKFRGAKLKIIKTPAPPRTKAQSSLRTSKIATQS